MELLNAIETESLLKIKELIKSKNISLDNNLLSYRALMKAFAYERKDVIKFLLQNHCHVNVLLKNYSFTTTPLHCAIKLRDINLVADILAKKPCITKVDSDGNTPLHLAFLHKFEEAVDLILEHIEKTSDYVNSENKYGLSHMHIACTRNNAKVIYGFMDTGVDFKDSVSVNSPYWAGYTTFHFACEFGSWEAFKIINHDDIVTCKTKKGLTAVQICKAHLEDLLVMYYFLDDEPFNVVNKMYFHLVCVQDKPSLLTKFFENDVNVNYTFYNLILNPSRNSALQVAVVNNCEESVKLLLQHGANFEYKNRNSMTALHLALYNESPYLDGNIIVDLLYKALKLKDNVSNIEDENGLGYFEIAVTRNDMEMVEKLLKNGLDINKLIKPNNKDFSHFTPLHFALFYKHKEMAKLLINKGANVDLTGEENRFGTPLHMAFEIGDEDLIELLLNKGADVKLVRPFDGRTMLHSLARSHISESLLVKTRVLMYIEQLIKLGIDVNARNKYGCTALHQLYIESLRKVGADFQLLLEFGADINAEDANGCLPFHFKRYNSNCCASDEYLIFYHHVQKLKALGLQVHPKNDEICKMIEDDLQKLEPSRKTFVADELACRQQQRLDEIARLKSIMITSYTSLYDFLKFEPKRAAIYMPNDVIEEILEDKDFNKTYPSYGYLIRLKYKRNFNTPYSDMNNSGSDDGSHSSKRQRLE